MKYESTPGKEALNAHTFVKRNYGVPDSLPRPVSRLAEYQGRTLEPQKQPQPRKKPFFDFQEQSFFLEGRAIRDAYRDMVHGGETLYFESLNELQRFMPCITRALKR